ncbi:hypothetical protein R6Q59_024332 [Mikania micrantha]
MEIRVFGRGVDEIDGDKGDQGLRRRWMVVEEIDGDDGAEEEIDGDDGAAVEELRRRGSCRGGASVVAVFGCDEEEALAQDEFDELCFEFGIELDDLIFEVGDVIESDELKDVGASNRRHLAALYCGATSGFLLIHVLLDKIMGVTCTSFVSAMRVTTLIGQM